MANAVENTHRGTVIDMENCRTSSPGSEAVQTFPRTANGPAIGAIGKSATPDRSSLLSDADRIKLARIQKDRRLGWMPTFQDFDFLLEMVERLSTEASYSDRENPDL